jgi:TolB-like protein
LIRLLSCPYELRPRDRDDYLEELVTELAKMNSFRVISRTSVMLYKKTSRALPEIDRELNVNALVESTVRRSGDRVRITVQLLGNSPERHIWADQCDGDVRDVLLLEREVARDIVANVRNKLGIRYPLSPRPARRVDS